jgi:uncharacterized protein YbdZ (MbtH family)
MGFPDRTAPQQFPHISFSASVQLRGHVMLGSGIIDVAIGLAFVFGVTAALSSVFTELVARFLGLRGEYLLRGLRELLDSGDVTTDLKNAETDYRAWRDVITTAPAGAAAAGETAAGRTPAAKTPAKKTPAAKVPEAKAPAGPQSATGALLGSPLLRGQGMAGQIINRPLILKPVPQPVKKPVERRANQASPPAGPPARPPEAMPPPLAKLETSAGKRPWRVSRTLPAYISATSFTDAVIDLMVPDSHGLTTMDAIKSSLNSLGNDMPAPMRPLVKSIEALVTSAGDDVKSFRTSVEKWYDDHMARVSGWYKRRVAKITIVIGAILVLLLNLNTLTIGRTLYSNSVVRTAVSSVAGNSTSCPAGQNQQECLASLQAQLSAAAQAGLPIGWGIVSDCAARTASCNWLDQRGIFSRHGGSGWQAVLVLIGFLITIIALTPGARFWFDLLGKLGSLRSTGPKPAPPAT